MEEDEDFFGSGGAEPEGFGAVGEGDGLGGDVLFFGIGEISFFEGGAEPLNVSDCHVGRDSADEGYFGMGGEFGRASVAAEEAGEEGEDTV